MNEVDYNIAKGIGREGKHARELEFGEWLFDHVPRPVPHRHFVLSILKILRRFFLHDRKLLAELSRCGRDALRSFLKAAVPAEDGIQT